MTTTTAPARGSHSAGRGVTFGGVLRSEWIKLRSLRSTWWCAALIVVVIVGFAALLSSVTGSGPQGTPGAPVPEGAEQQSALSALTIGIVFAQLVAAVLGALIITGEFGTGMIRSTFAAVPRRTAALVAKVLLVGLLTLVASALGLLGALGVSLPLLDGAGISPDLGDGRLWTALLAAAGSVALTAMMAFGIGAIIRNGAGAIAASVGIVFVLPILFAILVSSVQDAAWPSNLQEFSPAQAATRMYEYPLEGSDNPLVLPPVDGAIVLDPWQAALVMAGWVVVFFVIGLALVKRRDV